MPQGPKGQKRPADVIGPSRPRRQIRWRDELLQMPAYGPVGNRVA